MYFDNLHTLYCGCTYTSHDDSDGSGDIDMAACGMTPLPLSAHTTGRIEWEHIVPASLMPARQRVCWRNPSLIAGCAGKSGRKCCEENDPVAQGMLFDLHNLAPSVGQVNQYRQNGRYREIASGASPTEWQGCGVKDLGGVTSGAEHLFEPADCTKGDVARVWFYMHDQHGVEIPDAEWNMFVGWANADPVTAWEIARDERIADEQGNHNPYVQGWTPNAAGECPWDPSADDLDASWTSIIGDTLADFFSLFVP